ncbi:MAG: hypothetical protein DI539_28140 [Flavobacterium psychrophilum]|nr:MAG: hypothetical protein DI539_28140 [Flavobacterium psychrophilum]
MTKIVKNPKYEELVQREFDPVETLKLLQHTNQQIFWSWGVEKAVNYNNLGLILLVNGRHHSGVVFVRLSYDDTYSYFLLNPDLSVKREVHNVYFDELQERIDKDIEYIKLYDKY